MELYIRPGSYTSTTAQGAVLRSLAEVQSIFIYLELYQVLICREHATAIQCIDAHLQKHHVVPRKLRKEITAFYSIKQLCRPQDILLPAPLGPPVEALGPPLAGFQCNQDDCDWTTVSVDELRKHGNKEHQVSWRGKQQARSQQVQLQTFFRGRALRRYFVVSTDKSRSIETRTPRVTTDVIRQRLAAWQTTQQVYEEEAEILDAEAAKTDRTGWFKRTGWLEHFAKRNLAHLAYQLRLPDRGEIKIQRAAKLTELLIAKSVTSLSTLARETRRWLKSAKQSEIDQRPIARLQNPESQARYASYMVKFVCYFLRILADEERRIATLQDAVSEDSSGSADSSSDSGTDRDGPARRRTRSIVPVDMMKDARELFCWQGAQKGLAIRLWDQLDKEDEAAQETQLAALLDVLASFILQTSGNKPFSSGLVHFTAVLGIDKDMGRLRTAKNYSYMLAGVLYCMRVLAVEKLLPAAEREEERAEEARERFLEQRRRYLADGSYSPMSECLSLLAMGKHIALAAGNSGNAYWSTDKKIFYLNGRPIHLARFRRMAQDMVVEVEQMLWQELLWVARAADRFEIALEKLVDDVTFSKRGRSFVQHCDNGLREGLAWMLGQADQTEAGQKLQPNGRWSTWQVKRYLRRVERFLELLLVCVHVTSGQPGRGSEVTTMRHRNGVLQDRNIFVMDGQIMTVVRYHKSQSQWDKPKVVPRFLPPRLGQVTAVYLAYLQPFQEYLAVQVLGGGFCDYVWGDQQGPWETERLTRVLKRETGKRLGVELHTLDYRHTAVGIGRVVVGDSFSKGYQDEVGEIEEAEVDEGGEDVVELQNSRTTVMGVGNYSVPVDIVKHLSIRSIEAFRPLSTLWHRFLGLEGGNKERGVEDRDGKREVEEGNQEEAWQVCRKEKRGRDMDEKDTREWVRRAAVEKQARVGEAREKEIERAMQQVLGTEQVGFRSVEQERAMYAVLDRQTPLVVVLPTGGGKSLLFTVPGCLEGQGVTVVVVPYRALIEDLVSRIRKSGVECIEWKHGESNPASVVVVSADVAGDVTSNGNFISYAGLLNEKGLLRRVVVDECHLIFTSSGWRPKLAKLQNLRLLPCPVVLLTATLPPVRKAELERAMRVEGARYIRASTVRPNIRYLVSWCQPGTAQETALAMCRQRIARLQEQEQRGVVYRRSKAECEIMAAELGCGYYHAGDVERAAKLAVWLETGGLIIATSALGTGLDYGRIVFVLHVGMPWSMIDFAQESGRGGRAGEAVDSVIVVEEGEVERTMKQKEEDIDVQALGLMLIGEGCRRGLMSRYLDGRQVTCNDIEGAGCDRCGEGVAAVLAWQQQASREWEGVERRLGELRDGCTICAMLDEGGTEAWRGHKVRQCTRHEGVHGADVDKFRQQMLDGGGAHSCRRCWVSQKYCATGQDMQQQCQWPNVVVPLARAVVEQQEGQRLVREVGFTGEFGGDWKEYGLWLGKRHRERVWGEFFSNAMVVAIRVLVFIQRRLGE